MCYAPDNTLERVVVPVVAATGPVDGVDVVDVLDVVDVTCLQIATNFIFAINLNSSLDRSSSD